MRASSFMSLYRKRYLANLSFVFQAMESHSYANLALAAVYHLFRPVTSVAPAETSAN